VTQLLLLSPGCGECISISGRGGGGDTNIAAAMFPLTIPTQNYRPGYSLEVNNGNKVRFEKHRTIDSANSIELDYMAAKTPR